MKKSALYEYLTKQGILETATKEQIAEARTALRKEYKANWQRSRRKQQKSCTISLDKKEESIILKAAKKHHQSAPSFIKNAALSYISGQYLVPNIDVVNGIKQSISLLYTELDQQTNVIGIGSERNRVIEQLLSLETTLINSLSAPPHLENTIRDLVYNNPEYKQKLIDLLITL